MSRIARVIYRKYPHHVTLRGNYRQDVFRDDADKEKYAEYLNEYATKYKLPIISYCLMSNHIHFIVVPMRDDSLAKTFNMMHMRYSQYFNKEYGLCSGHLWQGRFYSCVLDEPHLLAAVRYAERNPVRAGLVEKPWLWEWSSCTSHVGENNDVYIDCQDVAKYIDLSAKEWKNYVDDQDNEFFMNDLKRYTAAGYPYGSPTFIGKVEKVFGKKLTLLSRGRPKKNKKHAL